MLNPPGVQALSDSGPIKFGILGAAHIAPTALISPANNHPEVEVYVVAARDQKRLLILERSMGYLWGKECLSRCANRLYLENFLIRFFSCPMDCIMSGQ